MEGKMKRINIIEIQENGDLFGKGYTGTQTDNRGGIWWYRGDIGAKSRRWWREYAKKNDIVLRIK